MLVCPTVCGTTFKTFPFCCENKVCISIYVPGRKINEVIRLRNGRAGQALFLDLEWKSTFLSGSVPVAAVLHFLSPCPFNHYHKKFSFFRLIKRLESPRRRILIMLR